MKYVYPVISRRSGGLSIGVNLSPTARCNFACVYCQVLGDLEVKLQNRDQVLQEGDRKRNAHLFSPLVDIERLESELRELIEMVASGELFNDDLFVQTPPEKRVLQDIAFSGDGEPTLSLQFSEIVRRVVAVRQECCPATTKLVLITNGTCLDVPAVRAALQVLRANHGEVWTKLDAGTEEYFRTVSRSTLAFEKILANLASAAKEFPIVVQSCFLSIRGIAPSTEEIRAYASRLRKIVDDGGSIQRLQIYTVARNTPEPWAKPLPDDQLDDIAATVRRETDLSVETFYSR